MLPFLQVCSTETTKQKTMQMTPHPRPGTRFLMPKVSAKLIIQTGSPPTKAPNPGGVG